MLPQLLHCIRMIWNVSRFYNTPERLTDLLRKVSTEIINRCCDHISLDEIFQGDVEACMVVLRQSIQAGEAWKRSYRTTATAVGRRASAPPWDFDVSSIFSHIDAFVQRCRDLLEVCEAQTQFASKADLPAFGSTRGPEITKSLLDIQTRYVMMRVVACGVTRTCLGETEGRLLVGWLVGLGCDAASRCWWQGCRA